MLVAGAVVVVEPAKGEVACVPDVLLPKIDPEELFVEDAPKTD